MNWDDLRLFLNIARAGGLTGAIAITGASAPTLSRRMTTLEQSLGITLFNRRQGGYTLTESGTELFDYAYAMDEQAQLISSWRNGFSETPTVKITAGSWTSIFLAKNLANSIGSLFGEAGPRIELITGASFLSFARKEADLGIRNQMPEQPGLVRQRIGLVRFAIYGSKEYLDRTPKAYGDLRYGQADWVITAMSGATGASSKWIIQRMDCRPRMVCANSNAMLEAVAEGMGLCILPCFVGEIHERLKRCSAPIEELTHTQWLVSHQENRKLPHIQKTSRALFSLFKKNRALFECDEALKNDSHS